MGSILLPIQFNGLGQGYCFEGWDKLGLDLSNAQNAILENGRSFYNIGDTKPAPELQGYPWLRTTDGRWYVFQGVWRAPNNYDGNERRLWAGDLTQLVTYDGGSAGAVTPTTGPMWIDDTDAQGRVPMSPGLIPGTTTPAKTLAVGEQYGSGEHALTDAEGAVGAHKHMFGLTHSGNDDAYFSQLGAPTTVPSYQGFYITGSDGNIIANNTTADLQTLPSGTDGKGVTPTPFSIVPPVIGIYVIRPSGRQFYVVP